MKFVQLTLNGVSCCDQNGTMAIQRRTARPVSIIASADYSSPMELAAILSPGTWESAFWFPHGKDDDKDSFFTWVISVRADQAELVKAACQTRTLTKE